PDHRLFLSRAEGPAARSERAGRRDGREGGGYRDRRAPVARGGGGAGYAMVHGAAPVVFPGSAVSRRGVAPRRPRDRRGAGLSRGSQAESRQRLVAFRARGQPSSAREDGGGGAGRRAVQEILGAGRYRADLVAFLAGLLDLFS